MEEIVKKLEVVESVFEKYGGSALDINEKNREKFDQRRIYYRDGWYYRADSAKFDDSGTVWIVISCTDNDKHASVGIMEDIAAFESELDENEIEQEIRYAFGIDEYPDDYMTGPCY